MDAELPHWLCASLLEDEEKEKNQRPSVHESWIASISGIPYTPNDT